MIAYTYNHIYFLHNIVDWKNPALVDMLHIPWFLGFYTSHGAWDFFHQGINSINPCFWTNSSSTPWAYFMTQQRPDESPISQPGFAKNFRKVAKNGGFPKEPDFRPFFGVGYPLHKLSTSILGTWNVWWQMLLHNFLYASWSTLIFRKKTFHKTTHTRNKLVILKNWMKIL